MNKRPLGNTGILVSEIAFGGVEIGKPYGIGVNRPDDMLSEQEAIRLLDLSVEKGINFFDTASNYGNSESIIGKAFKDKRDKVILETKCKNIYNEDGSIPEYAKLYEIIESSLNKSLETLKTDYIDVFMLHQGYLDILENGMVTDIFSDLKKSEKIQAIGVSTYTQEETKKAIEAGVWDVIQLPFNMMDQRQETLFSLATKKGIGIIIRSVLLKGILSERGRNLHPALKDVEAHKNRYNELLDGSMELSGLATKFALSFPEVSSVLVGIDRVEYLHKSLEAANGNYLDDKTLLRAKELAYPDPDFLDLPEWDKKGWLR